MHGVFVLTRGKMVVHQVAKVANLLHRFCRYIFMKTVRVRCRSRWIFSCFFLLDFRAVSLHFNMDTGNSEIYARYFFFLL